MKTLLQSILVFSLCLATACWQSGARAAEPSLAADFTLPALDGQTFTLSQYRDKQPVLLFFWTTWCPFCLKEVKVLNAQQQEYADKGIVILAVNAGESAPVASRLVKNYAVTMTVLLDEQDTVTRAYRVLGVPHFVLIDKQGFIRFKGTHFPKEELENVAQPAG